MFLGESGGNITPTRPRKVLILLLGAIGDVTRALPLAVRIKKAWPETSLHWAVEPISRDLVEQHPALDKVTIFDRPGGIRAYIRFVRELRSQQYDLVLDLQRHFKSGVTSFATGAKRRIGFHPRNAKEGNWLFSTEYIARIRNPKSFPKILHYQKFGDYLGLPPQPKLDFGFSINEERKAIVERILQEQAEKSGTQFSENSPYAAFVLGSTWESRLWPASYYQQVIPHISKRWGILSVLVGGEKDRQFAQEVVKNIPGRDVLNLVGQVQIRDLPILFSNALFAVGVDSGPTHIAAANNCPVIALFGSTSSSRSVPFHPDGPTPYVIQSPVGCSPCYRRKCPGLQTLCMSSIPVAAVRVLVDSILEKQGKRGNY